MFKYIQQKLGYSICNTIKNTGIFTAVETGFFARRFNQWRQSLSSTHSSLSGIDSVATS